MFILTRKLVDNLISVSNTKTLESHQSFSLILPLLLPTNIPIEQYCYSCNPQSESFPDKRQANILMKKQESEKRYTSLISQGYPSYFFSHTSQSNHLNLSSY